jgi:hypothetical protein
MVSAAGKKIPVFESPVGVIDGALVLPADTVAIPKTIFGIPDKPVALPVTLPTKLVAVTIPKTIFGIPDKPVALPVTLPTKLVAVTIPVALILITAGSSAPLTINPPSDAEIVSVLPFI